MSRGGTTAGLYRASPSLSPANVPWAPRGVQRADASDALRLRGEVHALEEGLEAGAGADGVGDK